MTEDETSKGGISVTSYADILPNEPDDPAAKAGYDDLLQAWKAMSASLEKGRPLAKSEFAALMQQARRAMMPREAAFFDEPHETGVREYEDLFQAKTTGRLTKILLDRHGFKVPKEGGGLG